MKNYVYLAVTPDKYELPIALFEDVNGACKFSNKSKPVLWGAIRKQSVDKANNCKYVGVMLENEN